MLVGLPEGDPEGEKWVQAFLRGMAQLGWRLGTNFQLDLHWVATDFNRTQAIAKQLVEISAGTDPSHEYTSHCCNYARDADDPRGVYDCV